MKDKKLNTILAVDKDSSVHERESTEWVKYGINAFRVDTMTEAINLLVYKNDFLFVAINEDTIPNFLMQLRIMRDITALPIFVITSNYTIEKNFKAMSCGADLYDHFNAYIKTNVLDALAFLKTQNRWAKHPAKPLPVITRGDIILSRLRKNVFIKDINVSLTKIEFEILHCLMANSECIVTHERLVRKVWGDKRELKTPTVLWRIIDRLRKKLSEVSPSNEYIEVERGVGYRFLAP